MIALKSTPKTTGRRSEDNGRDLLAAPLSGRLPSCNHERSPVHLTSEAEYGTWLTGTPDEAFGLIKSSDPERMSIVQSGFDKEDLLATG
jgi:hypothetical protein